jgi:hypothetical protein
VTLQFICIVHDTIVIEENGQHYVDFATCLACCLGHGKEEDFLCDDYFPVSGS